MKVSSEEMRNTREVLILHRYGDLLVGKISRDLQNICKFVPLNMASKCRRLFHIKLCKPKILQKYYFLKKPHSRPTGLMVKNNVDFKFDFIGTLKPNSPLADVVNEQTAAWQRP